MSRLVRSLGRQRSSPLSLLRSFTVRTVSTAGFIAWCASCSWLFQEYCYEWVSSAGPSMYPTLPNETKYILVNKRYRLGRGMKVGDLVHTKHPSFRNLRAGKRIVGMPGDLVVRDPAMAPTVGGMDVRGAVAADGDAAADRQEPVMIEVPPGHVWVAGDNLSYSRDSRFFGPVPMGLILGKIVRHSSPSSDWMVDMVSANEDQLRPVQTGFGTDVGAGTVCVEG